MMMRLMLQILVSIKKGEGLTSIGYAVFPIGAEACRFTRRAACVPE